MLQSYNRVMYKTDLLKFLDIKSASEMILNFSKAEAICQFELYIKRVQLDNQTVGIDNSDVARWVVENSLMNLEAYDVYAKQNHDLITFTVTM